MPPVVPSSMLTPGLALAVILVAGGQGLGAAPRRGLIVAPISADGTATPDTMYSAVSGPDAVADLLGPGTQGHLCALAAFAEFPTATIDVIGVEAPSGALADQTLTFDDNGGLNTPQTVDIYIAGRHIQYIWLPGIDDDTAAADVAALVAAKGNDLPVSPSVTAAVLTLEARYDGTWGNDVLIRATISTGDGEIVLGGAMLDGGSGEPDFENALANMLGKEHDLIAYCTSNEDCGDASADSTPSLVNAKIATRNTGFDALLQQSVFAHTGSLSDAKAGIAQQNIGYCQIMVARNMESLPCELQGAELGARLREESKDPNVNRTNRLSMPYRARLYPPADILSDAYTPAELEDLLQSGGSAIVYTSNGTPLVSIPRTTYFKDSFDNLDHRLIGVNQTTTYYAVGKGVRSFLPDRFDGMKLIPDPPQTADELPLGVVDESTIRAALILYLDDALRLGWLRRDKLQAAIDEGSLSVKVDPGNENRVIIRLPISAVPGLWGFDVTILGGS